MKTFGKAVIVFLVFFLGTAAVVHVDRQCAQMEACQPQIVEKLENYIEN